MHFLVDIDGYNVGVNEGECKSSGQEEVWYTTV